MSLYQRDYILRMIERIAAVIARAMRRKNDGDAAGARADIAAATAELFGPAGQMIPFVDVRTAVDLLSDPDRVTLYARLLDADAELLEAMGKSGVTTRQRALALMQELERRTAVLSDETHAFLAELRARCA